MPQDISFDVPFRSRINLHCERARSDHFAWVQARGLVRNAAEMKEYASWDLPRGTALTYPEANLEDLTLLMNFFAIGFLLDDEFDMADMEQRLSLVKLCRDMSSIPLRHPGTPPCTGHPLALAWCEVWADLCRGMSPSWQKRFAAHWGDFIQASLEEAELTARARVLAPPSYQELRRRSVGIYHSLDVAERSRRFELPQSAIMHPVMREFRAAATDTIGFMNDVQSLERDERRGNVHNLVTVLKRELGCARHVALTQAIEKTQERLSRVFELQTQVASMCSELGLSRAERSAVDQGVEAAWHWIRGNYDWARESGRYASTGFDNISINGRRPEGFTES
jgi:hypothetical protein